MEDRMSIEINFFCRILECTYLTFKRQHSKPKLHSIRYEKTRTTTTAKSTFQSKGKVLRAIPHSFGNQSGLKTNLQVET